MVIENILQGIEGVVIHLDDILITDKSKEVHLKTLDEVLNRLDRTGLRVKQSKCEFFKFSVTYLGHKSRGAAPCAREGQGSPGGAASTVGVSAQVVPRYTHLLKWWSLMSIYEYHLIFQNT